MFALLIVVLGLSLFEFISSVDNAIINAHVLKTLQAKYRRWFLTWGLIFAVFVVRGILPFVIVWMTSGNLSFIQVLNALFHSDPLVKESLEASKPLLLIGGGSYLFFVFLAWLFLEEKKYAFLAEGFMHRQGVWFYAVSSLFTTFLVYYALQINPTMALAVTIGVTAFFITDGFKRNAEEKEKELMTGNMSAWSKLLYLEILDLSFSIDGVIGAFAFTMSVPLILLGNGIGALAVRELTIKGIDTIGRFAYLKNGAMYSIGFLGMVMVMESLGGHFPFWLTPALTFSLLSLFLWLSVREWKIKTINA